MTFSQESTNDDGNGWQDWQTIAVNADQDSDKKDEVGVISIGTCYFSCASDTYTFAKHAGILTLKITDDDKPVAGNIVVTPSGTLSITEGGTGTLNVALSARPSNDVTVTLTKTHADVTIDTDSATAGDQATLTFTRDNYSTTQPVTVSAAEDNDRDSETDIITFTATGGIDASDVTKDVSITDNDAPAGTIVVTPSADLSIDEGDTTGATLSVNLTGTPNASVSVTLTSSDSDVTLDPDTLTFAQSSPGTVQTVTVKANDDADTVHETVTITLAATGGISAPNVTKTVKVNDNDKPQGAIEISPTGTLDIDEGDTTGGTFTVKLSARPNADVTVTLAKTNPDVTLSATTLTFTASNYQTVQTVTVKAAEDTDAADETDTITLTATGGITASAVTKAIAVDDDEPPAGNIEVSPSGRLTIAEGGSGELKVKLSVEPESSVTVTLTNTNTDVTIDTDSATAGNQDTLTFTAANYDQEQTVTVTAAEDDDSASETDTITFTPTPSGGITASAVTKAVSINDNDAPTGTIEVTPAGALTIPEGGSQVLSIKLDTLPDSTVTVSLSKTDADVTLTPTSLTFLTTNYQTVQTVTVSTSHDDDADDDTDTITITASGGIDAMDVTKEVTITDDDDPRVTIDVTPTGTLSIDEGDSSGATLMVKLGEAPKANVNATVTLEKTNPDVSLSATTLTFTAANYEDAQPVTVTARQDDDTTDETDTITLKAGTGIRATDVTRDVTITDDDIPTGTIQISPPGTLTIDEGGSQTLSIVLSNEPKTDVTVSVSSSNGDVTIDTDSATTGDQTTLTFTKDNYDTAQTVSVSAAEDGDNVNDTATLSFSATGGLDASDATKAVTVTDDEAPTPPPQGRILLSHSGTLTIEEGESQTISVSLSERPISNVTVSFSKTNRDVSLNPSSSLTFTPSNYSEGQPITVSAAEDDDKATDNDTITFEAAGGIEASPVEKAVFIEDNDRYPLGAIFLTGADGPPIAEGDSVSIGLSLSAAPEGSATLRVLSDIPDLVATPSSLTFAVSNYWIEQRVMLTAQEDEDALDEIASLRIEAPTGIQAPALTRDFLIVDDDKETVSPPGDTYGGTLVVTPGERLRIEEESDGLFDVRLSAVPKKTISVLITKTRFGIGLSRDSMTFTPSNWDEAQSVKISAHADSDKNDSAHFVTFAFEGKRIIREVLVADNDKELPRTQALALPPVGSGDEATLRIQCKQAKPCSVALECSTQVGGLVLEGSLPEPIPAFGTVSLTSIEIQRYTGGNSWAGRGRLGCTLRSSARIGSQVWTRSGDGVLVNNSAMIRSMMEGDVHRADIESIPSPDAFDESNIRIRCNSDSGHCEDTAFACYTDDGTSYAWELGRIDRRTTRHLQSQELAEGIGHRWENLGLSCELRSRGKFTVQVLTRTGGGGALVNNSATGER